MLYYFEEIILAELLAKYDVEFSAELYLKDFDRKTAYEYRRVVDKMILSVAKEVISNKSLYDVIRKELTVTERLYILLPAFFELSLEETADAMFTTYNSVCSQRSCGLKKIQQIIADKHE